MKPKRLIANIIMYPLIIITLPFTIPMLIIMFIIINLDTWGDK